MDALRHGCIAPAVTASYSAAIATECYQINIASSSSTNMVQALCLTSASADAVCQRTAGFVVCVLLAVVLNSPDSRITTGQNNALFVRNSNSL